MTKMVSSKCNDCGKAIIAYRVMVQCYSCGVAAHKAIVTKS